MGNKLQAYYHDPSQGASLLLTCLDDHMSSHRCQRFEVFGYVTWQSGHYVIECDDISGKSLHTNITHVKGTASLYEDYVARERRSVPKRKLRQRRATGDYTIELLLVLDYSVYKSWYDETQVRSDTIQYLREFYAFLFNGVQERYRVLSGAQFTITIQPVGIVILENASEAPFTETVKTSTNQVDAITMLAEFKKWVNNKLASNTIPKHDHAMAFTRYDITKDNDNGVTGYAYLSKICTSESQSILEDQFNFISHTVAAHELGHSLNAVHDGDQNSCLSTKHYIMAASSAAVNVQQNPADIRNPWIFSSCSVSEINNKINALDTSPSNCLLQQDSTLYDISGYLSPVIGQDYDVNQQCVYAVGAGSYACLGNYNGDYRNICTGLSCFIPATTSDCVLILPADGTTCGNKKWCQAGYCVSNSSAPTADETCLYGDSQQQIGSGSTAAICSSYIDQRPFQCYENFYSNTCCGSCKSKNTGISGCEYGNRHSSCSINHGSSCYSTTTESQCCQSCRSFLTLDQNCKYGDKAPNCVTTTQNASPLINSAIDCYNVATTGQNLDSLCCKTCQNYHTGNADCPYGDKQPGCLVNDCRFYNTNLLRLCCQTCANFITTTSTGSTITTTSSSSTKLPTWVIPAAAGGGGGLLLIILIVIGCCCCRRGNSEPSDDILRAQRHQRNPYVAQDKVRQGHANPAYQGSQGYIDPRKVTGPTVKTAQPSGRPLPPINRNAQQSVRSEHVYTEIKDPVYHKLQRGQQASGYYSQPYQGHSKRF